MVTPLARRAPIHWMSWLGFGGALVAGVLALYGGMAAEKHLPDSPLREARHGPWQEGAPLPDENRSSPKPGPLHERLAAKAEASAFGGDLDRKILDRTTKSKGARYLVQFFAFFLPFLMGVGAALTGGWAMKLVQASGGQRSGNTLAVFSMMIGGLAAVVAGCMITSLYIWPAIPSLYGT